MDRYRRGSGRRHRLSAWFFPASGELTFVAIPYTVLHLTIVLQQGQLSEIFSS